MDVPEHSQRHSLFSALQAFSISFGGKLYLSRFTHLIFWLCYLDFGLLCRPQPSCLQYLMRERVSPIKVHASDLQTSSFLPLEADMRAVTILSLYL